MVIEMSKLGLTCECQKLVSVYYDKQKVGEYEAEMIVDKCVAVNIEVNETASSDDELKTYYFLRASNFEVGLFLNFGRLPVHKRKYLSNLSKSTNELNK
jgi:GxxExxY protein